MTFIYNTGDVIVFGILLLALIAILVLFLIAVVNDFVRKIGRAFDRAFQFNMLKEKKDGA